jgi:hypothetical protein
VGIIGIRGYNIFSLRNLPFKMMALFKMITGDPTFSCKLCGGMSAKSNELKTLLDNLQLQ